MKGIFQKSLYNGDISNWNTKNVKFMRGMFEGSEFFGEIGNWKVDNVQHFFEMFKNSKVTCDLSKWRMPKLFNNGNFLFSITKPLEEFEEKLIKITNPSLYLRYLKQIKYLKKKENDRRSQRII